MTVLLRNDFQLLLSNPIHFLKGERLERRRGGTKVAHIRRVNRKKNKMDLNNSPGEKISIITGYQTTVKGNDQNLTVTFVDVSVRKSRSD